MWGSLKRPSPRAFHMVDDCRAVILSELFPGLLWMAHASCLTLDMLEPLKDCRVTLFPRTDDTQDNYLSYLELADMARRDLGLDVTVSPLLEEKATPEQKDRKIDLVDFLFNAQ